VYGYPKDEAARVAVDAVRSANTGVEVVRLVAFSTDDLARYDALLA
jgi:O-acetyl-ADP-ribose deacetylase (regulator of RNase III)